MIDPAYYEWFAENTDQVVHLTWCSVQDVDDVLAAFDITTDSVRPINFGADDIRILVGRLGNGAIIMEYGTGYTTGKALRTLAQYGPCLSAQWCDEVPALVSYRTERGIVAEFDPIVWDWDPVPDLGGVERWIDSTPAGRRIWEDDWGFALLVTAEALFQGLIDENWMRATHVGITLTT